MLFIINASTAMSMAALVFAGRPPAFFFLGVTILFLSLVVCVLGTVAGSGLPIMVVGPRSGFAPIYAAMVASIAAALPPGSPSLVPTIIAAFMVGTALTGLFMFVLGQGQIGNIIRYIPFPVMAGFFAGIGLIFLAGGLGVTAGVPVSLSNAGVFLGGDILKLVAPALLFAATLYLVTRRIEHWSVVPAFIFGAIALFYGLTGALGMTAAERVAEGWLPVPSRATISLPLMSIEGLSRIEWPLVARQAGAFASLGLIAALILLLEISGVEMALGRDIDYRHELKATGITNVVSGLLGGYAGVHAASDTVLAQRLGARTHLMGLAFAAALVATLLVGTALTEGVPKFLLGGLLLYLGIDFLVSWGWVRLRGLPLQDRAIVLVILVTIAFLGLLPGIGIGLVIAIVLFVVSFSRMSVVKAELRGDAYSSPVVRDPTETGILTGESRRIRIYRLRHYLFFGTADRLYRLVQSHMAEGQPPRTRYMIFDLRNVSGLDTTACQSLLKLDGFARREHLLLIIAGAEGRMREGIIATGVAELASMGADGVGVAHSPSLEDAFIWCEEDILRGAGTPATGPDADLPALLELMTGSRAAAQALAPLFTERRLAAGDVLFREGEVGDGLYVLLSGSAAVLAQIGDKERVVRIYQQGTMLGEIALFTGGARTATVRAVKPSRFFRLGKAEFQMAQDTEPAATALLQNYVIRLLADRLERTNQEVRALP